eukprot:4831274-Prymnesium_polylepis.1
MALRSSELTACATAMRELPTGTTELAEARAALMACQRQARALRERERGRGRGGGSGGGSAADGDGWRGRRDGERDGRSEPTTPRSLSPCAAHRGW